MRLLQNIRFAGSVSVASIEATRVRLPRASADLTIDDTPDRVAIDAQLAELERRARVVAFGHTAMQTLTLLHSDSFPIGRYSDALLAQSITSSRLETLDHLGVSGSSLRVVVVDPGSNGKSVTIDSRTAVVGIGLTQQPSWLTG